MTSTRVSVVLPFDFSTKASLKGRGRDEHLFVRDRFETLVPVRERRDGTLVHLGRNGRGDTALPILGGRAYRPVCGISARDPRAPVDEGPIDPASCEGIADTATVQGKKFEWARPQSSPVRIVTDSLGRVNAEIVSKAFLDRRATNIVHHDRDAKLAAAIEDASHLAIFDGRLYTALRVPVVQGDGIAGFLEFPSPWATNPRIVESHSIATVLASSGRAALRTAGFAGDVHLVASGFDDLLLGFDMIASRILKRTDEAVRKASDETFSLYSRALASIRGRRKTGTADQDGLEAIVSCSESMTGDGIDWGPESGNAATPGLTRRLRHHYLRGTSPREAEDDSWAEEFRF